MTELKKINILKKANELRKNHLKYLGVHSLRVMYTVSATAVRRKMMF